MRGGINGDPTSPFSRGAGPRQWNSRALPAKNANGDRGDQGVRPSKRWLLLCGSALLLFCFREPAQEMARTAALRRGSRETPPAWSTRLWSKGRSGGNGELRTFTANGVAFTRRVLPCHGWRHGGGAASGRPTLCPSGFCLRTPQLTIRLPGRGPTPAGGCRASLDGLPCVRLRAHRWAPPGSPVVGRRRAHGRGCHQAFPSAAGAGTRWNTSSARKTGESRKGVAAAGYRPEIGSTGLRPLSFRKNPRRNKAYSELTYAWPMTWRGARWAPPASQATLLL